MHLFLKKIYRKNPFPKIYRINQCEVLSSYADFSLFLGTKLHKYPKQSELSNRFRFDL